MLGRRTCAVGVLKLAEPVYLISHAVCVINWRATCPPWVFLALLGVLFKVICMSEEPCSPQWSSSTERRAIDLNRV